MSKETYHKLITENNTKDHKPADKEAEEEINREAKSIATELKLADRIERFSEAPAYVTVKDH